MAWFVLIASGTCEAVWAMAISLSNGFKKLLPSIVFVVALSISMGGLAFAMQSIPTGTAYAAWTGVGAVLAVMLSAAYGHERLTWAKVVLLSILICSIIGLKVVA